MKPSQEIYQLKKRVKVLEQRCKEWKAYALERDKFIDKIRKKLNKFDKQE